jgi:acyl-coenzyme A thioesterase PaaI-like protein
VVARAEVVKAGSQLIVVECKVLGGTTDDGHDHVVAMADFSMMIVPLRRPMTPGAGGEPGDPEL